MADILLIAPTQPARTPRAVRNANALRDAGHRVTLLNPVFDLGVQAYDEKLARNGGWSYVGVPIVNAAGRIRLRHRILARCMWKALSHMGLARLGSLALMYGATRVAEAAERIPADFYLAQQHATVPIVAGLAQKHGKPFAWDIDDILAESRDEPRRLIASIERAYIQTASVLSTMSEAAAEHLQRQYGLARPVIPLHNSPSISERGSLRRPEQLAGRPSIYWFGQTLGPHSLALELIKANRRAGSPFRIALRGRPLPGYVDQLHAAAGQNGTPSFEILPYADPTTMVAEAAAHDVLFASQPSEQLFHQLAIGNKLFTGLLAGCAILASDTIAHRRLARGMGASLQLVNHRKDGDLPKRLIMLANDRERLLAMRQAAWDLGTARFNWEMESNPWCSLITASTQLHG
jgi:hypothetical protein